jgi:hypothetical protein
MVPVVLRRLWNAVSVVAYAIFHVPSFPALTARLIATVAAYPLGTLLNRWMLNVLWPPLLGHAGPVRYIGDTIASEGFAPLFYGLPVACALVLGQQVVKNVVDAGRRGYVGAKAARVRRRDREEEREAEEGERRRERRSRG